jgi:alcohol dehydrogenase, propanol-preferring
MATCIVETSCAGVGFDSLEYEPAFRWADVAAEIALLLVDLEWRGYHEHAHAFLSGYLARSGDYALVIGLNLYKAHWALVRAKVAALEARQALGTRRAPAWQREARLLLQCATRALGRHQPRLLLTCGLSGSGKTWLARQLATRLHLVHLRSDVERKRAAGLEPLAATQSLPGQGLYTDSASAALYRRLAEHSAALLAGGHSVIVDATFAGAQQRRVFRELARKLAVPVLLIHCQAPPETLRTRILLRQQSAADASEADAGVLQWQLEHFEPPAAAEALTCIDADTALPDVVDTVSAQISRSAPFPVPTVRAMRLEQPGAPLHMTERPTTVPAAGQIQIAVQACTDLHVVDGELPAVPLPLVPGHEIVGRVSALGAGVRNLQLGDRVGVPWLGWVCGQCDYCLKGAENLCRSARFTGYQLEGGFATMAIVDARFAFRLPENYSDEAAAPLMCAGAIGWRTLKLAGSAARLGIYGFGAAAHIVTQIARARGQQVYAFVRPGDEPAKQFALEMGACWAGDSTLRPPESLDAAIIFAPVGTLVPTALAAVRVGGTVVCGGIHMSDIPAFPYALLWGERTLRSVANVTRRDVEELLAFAAHTAIHTATTSYPLSAANQALEDLRTGQLRGAAVLIP